MKKLILTMLLSAFCITSTSCVSAAASEDEEVREVGKIAVKEGYYTCAEDNSYILISDGTIQIVGFDKDKYIENAYSDEVAAYGTDTASISFEEYKNEAEASIKVDDTPTVFSVMSFPGGEIMLVTERNETGKGGGAYFGYFLEDENTISGLYDYKYAGDTVSE